MPEGNFRARCGTWHGEERFVYRREARDQNVTADRFFSQEMRNNYSQNGDIQLFEEVVMEALQEKDQLKIEEM
jgi:hypothetical protein